MRNLRALLSDSSEKDSAGSKRHKTVRAAQNGMIWRQGPGAESTRADDGRRAARAAQVVGCALAALLVALPAASQQLSKDEAKKKLEADRSKLEQTQKMRKEIQSDVDKLASERERINARLVETGKLIQQSEAQLTQIEGRLGELEKQEENLRRQLQAKHGTISGLLAAMQRMGRNPPPVMVTQREDALSMVRSAMLIASAFPELRNEAVALGGQLDELARVMGSIRAEGDKLRAETARLDDARTRLSALQESKRQSLAERERELNKMGELASQISRNVQDLSELIGNLDKEVASRTGLGEYEQEAAKAPAQPARTAAVAPTAPVTNDAGKPEARPPAPPPEEKGVVLAPNEKVAMLSPGRIKPAIPFDEAKGMLPLPAQGKRMLSYGEKTRSGSESKGIVLQTRQGGQVIAPADGWVVFAGEFRSYGQLLIINAGKGYHLLLAGLSQIDVQLGQFVLAGEPVGVMPNSGAAARAPDGRAQDNAPMLYIEFRKDQKPVDPEPWWGAAARKVR